MIYEGIFKRYRWGGWTFRVLRNGRAVTSRRLSVLVAERVLKDVSERSVFVKGIVSP